MRIAIVGAGIFGATCARLLSDAGHRCEVFEARSEVGGNCTTRWCAEAQCFVHEYGAHIFHTDNAEVADFIGRFGCLNGYRHRVKAKRNGIVYSYPINLMTFKEVYGASTPAQAASILDRERVPIAAPGNMEEACLAKMGRALYELFVRDYTAKQWNCRPDALPASLAERVPVRLTFDDHYFRDGWQGIPKHGYTALIADMLRGIPVRLATRLEPGEILEHDSDWVIYTGSVDELLDYRLGALEYRSLRFEHTMVDAADYQGCAVMNYTGEEPWTRIIEHRHFAPGEVTGRTAVTREFPQDWTVGSERFYPVCTPPNMARWQGYAELLEREAPRVLLGGRLGLYRYLDMDKAVAAAMELTAGVLR